MSKLIYVTNASLDGYVEDAQGRIDWTDPSDQVVTAITELVRRIGTYLYGRRMYESMGVWKTDPSLARVSRVSADFADVWHAADKIVFSTTLGFPTTRNTRIDRHFDQTVVRELKSSLTGDLTIGGSALAAQGFAAHVIDECHLFIHPTTVGGGKSAFPHDSPVRMKLLDKRSFENGVVQLHYRVQN